MKVTWFIVIQLFILILIGVAISAFLYRLCYTGSHIVNFLNDIEYVEENYTEGYDYTPQTFGEEVQISEEEYKW